MPHHQASNDWLEKPSIFKPTDPQFPKRLYRNATLIQNISEFFHLVRPVATGLFEAHCKTGLDEESFWSWVLAEELEITYQLFESHHQMRRLELPYRDIYSNLVSLVPLSQYLRQYVRVPQLFGDNNLVTLKLNGVDLYIHYYRYPFEPLEIKACR